MTPGFTRHKLPLKIISMVQLGSVSQEQGDMFIHRYLSVCVQYIYTVYVKYTYNRDLHLYIHMYINTLTNIATYRHILSRKSHNLTNYHIKKTL